MSESPFGPPIDFSRYEWRPSGDDPQLFEREAGAAEILSDVWQMHQQQEQNVVCGVYASSVRPIAGNTLLEQLRRAWLAVRFEIPTLALRVVHKAPSTYAPLPTAYLTYRSPSSAEEAQAWADKTVRLRTDVKDLDELRYEVGQIHLPDEDGNQTLAFVAPFSEHSFGLLLYTSHVPFDGGAVKILSTKLLQRLAISISRQDDGGMGHVEWGQEVRNLLPIAQNVLGPDEKREGAAYDAALLELLTDYSKALPLAYGFDVPATRPSEKPVTRRIAHKFSLEQSSRIFSALKTVPSGPFTFNAAAHGALAIALCHDNPPPPDCDRVMMTNGLIDARPRLRAPYNSTNGFPGYCLAVTIIQVPVRVALPLSRPVKDQVLDAATVVREQYRKQRATPIALAVMAKACEVVLLSQSPDAPPWLGPQFAGDGRGEVYLQPQHKDDSGDIMITVSDFFVSVNRTEPGPMARATSWQGKIMLQMDYNEKWIPAAKAQSWLDNWAQFLLEVST